MPAPTATEVLDYLDGAHDEDTVESARLSELAALRSTCRVPADTEAWPADLAEALKRMVARNLAVRNMPLGFDTAAMDAGTTRIGTTDPEVRRLTAPYRRLVLG